MTALRVASGPEVGVSEVRLAYADPTWSLRRVRLVQELVRPPGEDLFR